MRGVRGGRMVVCSKTCTLNRCVESIARSNVVVASIGVKSGERGGCRDSLESTRLVDRKPC